ncbi:MAG: trigger factor [Chloroflexota bacterium]|nr:trigger factor [Chloroflexota bacterium]MDE2958937.1 trigger factor [Chloroflexota bacterium]
MKVTRDNSSPIEVTLTVELATEDENPFIDRSYRRVVSRLNIPGFRRGRAPRHIVESMMGRTALLQEALEFMVPETLDKVLQDEEVSAFGEPSIEVTELEPVSFTATVPLEPTVDLAGYRDIRVETEPVEVTDEEVDGVLDRVRDEQAVWEPVERAAEYGDRLNLNVLGTLDEETVVDDEDVEYIPNEENVLPFPGFAPNLVGLSEDDESEFTVTVPEDYPREQYAGKDIEFKVSVLSVKEKSVPDLDDEFAKSVGDGFDDLEALRTSIRESLTSQAENAARNDLEQKSLEALCDVAVVNASPLLYERELEAMQADRERMLRQQGLDLATYLRFMGKSADEFLDEMRPNAERRLVSALVMRKLAEVEEIEISDDDVQSETDRLLGLSSGDEEQDESNLDSLREFLGSESTRDNIRSTLHSRRVMERLTDIAQGKLGEDGSAEAGAADGEIEPASEPDTAETPDAAETIETTDASDGETTVGDQAEERE